MFCLCVRLTNAGGFEQQRSRPPPAAETGRRGWGSAPLFQSPAKGLRKKRQAQLVRPAEQSGGGKSPCGAFLDARLAQSTRAHQKNSSVLNTLEFFVLLVRENHKCGWIRTATATTAASGRNREELLGLRPAGCACRPRHEAAVGSRDPGSLFCAACAIHPRPPKNLNVYKCKVSLFVLLSIFRLHSKF